MGPFQICGCPFREPRVFEIAHMFWPWCLEFWWDEWSTTHKYTVLTTAPVLPRLCHVQCVCLLQLSPHWPQIYWTRTATCWGLRCYPNLAHTLLLYECLHTFYCCQSSWFWIHVKQSISFNSARFLFKDCYPPVIKRGNGNSSSMEVLIGKSLVAMFDYQGVSYLFPNDVSPKHIQPSLSCKTHPLMGYIPGIISQSAPLKNAWVYLSGFTNPPDSQIGAAHWRTWWVPGECRLRAARHRRAGEGHGSNVDQHLGKKTHWLQILHEKGPKDWLLYYKFDKYYIYIYKWIEHSKGLLGYPVATGWVRLEWHIARSNDGDQRVTPSPPTWSPT